MIASKQHLGGDMFSLRLAGGNPVDVGTILTEEDPIYVYVIEDKRDHICICRQICKVLSWHGRSYKEFGDIFVESFSVGSFPTFNPPKWVYDGSRILPVCSQDSKRVDVCTTPYLCKECLLRLKCRGPWKGGVKR